MPFCCQGRLQVHRYHQKHERHGQHHLLHGFKHKLQSTAGPGPGRTVPKPKPSKTTTTPHFREETSTTNLGRWPRGGWDFPNHQEHQKRAQQWQPTANRQAKNITQVFWIDILAETITLASPWIGEMEWMHWTMTIVFKPPWNASWLFTWSWITGRIVVSNVLGARTPI